MRYGFKAEANWYARSMRQELGLPPDSPLCPWRLAEHLDFPVTPLSEFELAEPAAVTYLRSQLGQREFSAITIFLGQKRLIVHNDAHAEVRQAANIAHELAHGLLHHPPKPPVDERGSRHYDAEREEEANWLGPALLVSEEAAVSVVRQGLSISMASRLYRVSTQVMQMRINVSGARKRAA